MTEVTCPLCGRGNHGFALTCVCGHVLPFGEAVERAKTDTAPLQYMRVAERVAAETARGSAATLATISFWVRREGDYAVASVGHSETTGVVVRRAIPTSSNPMIDPQVERTCLTMARLELARVLRNLASNLERLDP